MPITLIRVINEQKLIRSILLDKLDDGQANTEGYAYYQKQKVYVPYQNLLDDAGNSLPVPVKGYVDFVPTDRVLLSADDGTIHGMADPPAPYTQWVTTFAFSSVLSRTSIVTSAVHSGGPNKTTIGGSTFLSVPPDVTYVTFENLAGVKQTIPSSAFTTFLTNQIVILDVVVTIGVPGVGWKVVVLANEKNSVSFTM
jgi:hypothetical protein